MNELFGIPERKDTTLNKVGRFLSGFGAGYQGRGQEFLLARDARQQQLDERRQKAMARDAMRVYSQLNDGKYDDAIELIDDRVKSINELGGDASDTLEIRNLIVSGRLDEAQQELGGFLELAMQNGLIEAPKAPEAYTLGPGQVRFEGGRQIAAVPANQSDQGPLTPMAKLRADLAAGRITQGDFDAEMARINQPTAEQRPSAREAEIQDIMSTFGVDRAEAIRTMTERTITDPISGNLMRYNPITQQGSVVEMDIPSDTVQLGTPMRAEFEDLAFDPGKGTGFASSFIGLYNSTLGQIPILPISNSRSDAAQNLRILERDAINALATSSRPAVVEQERIISALPQAMDWFENPREAQSKTLSFIDLMTQQYVDDRRYASNARNPRTLREESSRRAGEVERIIGRVLTPDAATQMFESINKIERSIESVMNVPDSELFTIDPMTLDDAALDAYVERLKNGGR
jgi:hypothetical protein